MDRIEKYIDELMEKSTPDRPIWNIEKILQGLKSNWNYIDGCMIKAILDGKVGEIGTSFTADNETTYEITAGDPAEKQIIVGPPFAFTGENIADWAGVY